MDIVELQKKKWDLKCNLYQLIKEFHEETGVYISDINYYLINITPLGSELPEFSTGLNLEIKL